MAVEERSRKSPQTETEFPAIIGQSSSIRRVCRLIGAVAKSNATVLIHGESGTGKEVVANAIHAHSLRPHGPMVKVNCAVLNETLLESELFGHVKGAFTGAIRDRRGRFRQAEGGTIFLDEISCLPPAGQAKLLRVLQEHEFEPVGSSNTIRVDVRVLAATNVNLKRAVEEGRFREDLFYRLNVFALALPPLRERKEDIPLLVQHFLERFGRELNKPLRAAEPEALALLTAHDWPGNVRELENAIEHAVIVEKSALLHPESLPGNLVSQSLAQEREELKAMLGLRERLNLLERQILLETLARTNWIKKQAADVLRIDARNLPYLLRKHRLTEGHRVE
jgi:transcriptional regulator with GAF, ATPase, and Fis domain